MPSRRSWGRIWVVAITAIVAIPVGVGAAIYLEEYADETRWWNRLIELNIQNLAAVPSIVYGILGLAFLVRGRSASARRCSPAALTLSLLVLPIVIISSREAIRAVPTSIRQAALALGATQLADDPPPGAARGRSRASRPARSSRSRARSARPRRWSCSAALTFITFNPEGLDSAFTVLPIQIFNWISRPQEEFKVLAAAAIVVLLAILLAMNAAAIFLRNRYQRKW